MDLQATSILKRFARHWDTLPLMFDRVLPEAGYGMTVAAILRYLRGEGPRPGLAASVSDDPLLRGLDDLRDHVDWRRFQVRPERCRAMLASGPEDEHLLDRYPSEWTPLYVLFHVLLGGIEPTRGPAVVSATRDDGIRIIEFIAQYRALGFDAIYLYSNDSEDGSERLLELLAGHGVITYIRNDIAGGVMALPKALEHSVWKLPELRQHDWVFYADSDELLILPASVDHDINVVRADVERRYGRSLPAAVCYHWKWVVSGLRYDCSHEALLTGFQHTQPNTHLKSCVRLREVLDMRPLHFPHATYRSFFVDSMLDEIPQSRSEGHRAMWEWKSPRYEGGQLNHYWTKSFEEFAIKKRRGYGDSAQATDHAFDRFVEWNGAETEDNRDPPPAALVERVGRQMEWLRALPGVAEAEQATWAAQPVMLRSFGDAAALRGIYERLIRPGGPAANDENGEKPDGNA